jgi:hypothetical protein
MMLKQYEASVCGKREKKGHTEKRKADERDDNFVRVLCRTDINAVTQRKGQSLKETCPERESSSWLDWRSGKLGTDDARFSL